MTNREFNSATQLTQERSWSRHDLRCLDIEHDEYAQQLQVDCTRPLPV